MGDQARMRIGDSHRQLADDAGHVRGVASPLQAVAAAGPPAARRRCVRWLALPDGASIVEAEARLGRVLLDDHVVAGGLRRRRSAA